MYCNLCVEQKNVSLDPRKPENVLRINLSDSGAYFYSCFQSVYRV